MFADVDTSKKTIEHLADMHTGRTRLFKNKPSKEALYHFHKTTGEVLRALAAERNELADDLSRLRGAVKIYRSAVETLARKPKDHKDGWMELHARLERASENLAFALKENTQ